MEFNDKQIGELKSHCEKLAHDACEEAYSKWANELMRVSATLDLEGFNLLERTRLFCLETKPIFFRNYKNKLMQKIKEQIRSPFQQAETNPKRFEKFDIAKNRQFLEAYFTCGENARAAGALIGVPKSTFHDWLKCHGELVNSERVQRQKATVTA